LLCCRICSDIGFILAVVFAEVADVNDDIIALAACGVARDVTRNIVFNPAT